MVSNNEGSTSYDYVDAEIYIEEFRGILHPGINVSLEIVETGESLIIGTDSDDVTGKRSPGPRKAIESAILTLKLAITRLEVLQKKRHPMKPGICQEVNIKVRDISDNLFY